MSTKEGEFVVFRRAHMLGHAEGGQTTIDNSDSQASPQTPEGQARSARVPNFCCLDIKHHLTPFNGLR